MSASGTTTAPGSSALDFVFVSKVDATDDSQTQALTFNIACLPSIPGWFQVNSNELRPNAERAEQIANYILDQDAKGEGYDIVAFQEAWDEGNRTYLQKILDTENAALAKATPDAKFDASEHTKASNARIKDQLNKYFKSVTEHYKKHHHRKAHKLEKSFLQKHIAWCDNHYKQCEEKLNAHPDCMKKWLGDRIQEMANKTFKEKFSLTKDAKSDSKAMDTKTTQPVASTPLANTGLYSYCSKDAGQKLLNGGSGLLVFSKYEALSTTFIPFHDVSPGIEDLANKGFLAIEFKVPYSDKPLLFITAHFSGGSDKSKEELIALGLGTTSTIRSHQADQIRQYVQSNVLDDNAQPKYCNVIITGDFNDPYNTLRQFESISTGMTKTIPEGGNGMPAGAVKYNGRRGLLDFIDPTTAFPKTFIDIRVSNGKGNPKIDDEAKMQQAKDQKLATGSTYSSDALTNNLTDAKNNPLNLQDKTERKRFDVAVQANPKWVSQSGGFNSDILPITDTLSANGYPYAVSDHAPTQLLFKPAPNKPTVSSAAAAPKPTIVLSK